MRRSSKFKMPFEYFHLNFKLQVFPLFKSLDWMFLCHNLNKCLSEWPSLELHAVVMMDSHVHLLFHIGHQKENFFVAHLLKLLGQKQPQEMLVEPIKNYSQYLNTYKYIYRNPVEAGLCETCESYPYSSLHSVMGLSHSPVHVLDTLHVIFQPQKILSWLNSDTYLYSPSTKIDHRVDL